MIERNEVTVSSIKVGGFPPTLVQEGTKTIFLSGSARLYQKIDEAGQPAFFDIYVRMR